MSRPAGDRASRPAVADALAVVLEDRGVEPATARRIVEEHFDEAVGQRSHELGPEHVVEVLLDDSTRRRGFDAAVLEDDDQRVGDGRPGPAGGGFAHRAVLLDRCLGDADDTEHPHGVELIGGRVAAGDSTRHHPGDTGKPDRVADTVLDEQRTDGFVQHDTHLSFRGLLVEGVVGPGHVVAVEIEPGFVVHENAVAPVGVDHHSVAALCARLRPGQAHRAEVGRRRLFDNRSRQCVDA